MLRVDVVVDQGAPPDQTWKLGIEYRPSTVRRRHIGSINQNSIENGRGTRFALRTTTVSAGFGI